jgi:hypothetical protein
MISNVAEFSPREDAERMTFRASDLWALVGQRLRILARRYRVDGDAP